MLEAPAGAPSAPVLLCVRLVHSGFSFPPQLKIGVKSSAHPRLSASSVNQDLDFRRLNMTQEIKAKQKTKICISYTRMELTV